MRGDDHLRQAAGENPTKRLDPFMRQNAGRRSGLLRTLGNCFRASTAMPTSSQVSQLMLMTRWALHALA